MSCCATPTRCPPPQRSSVAWSGAQPEVVADTRRVSAPVQDRIATLTALVRAFDDQGIALDDIALRRPTLDEVFLQLTAELSG